MVGPAAVLNSSSPAAGAARCDGTGAQGAATLLGTCSRASRVVVQQVGASQQMEVSTVHCK
jgi:hypothetical protein